MKMKSIYQNFKKVKISWIVAISFILITIYMAPSFTLQELLTNGLLYSVIALPFLLALLPFAFIASFYFLWKGKKVLKVLLWFISCLIAFGIMIIPFFRPMFNKHTLAVGFWFLALSVSLVGTLLIFDSKDSFRKGYSKVLLIAILLCIPTMLKQTLPYLYSPPVLTKKSIKTYNEALSFLYERNNLTTFKINMRDWIPQEVRKVMTDADLIQSMTIRDKLIKVACYQFEKNDSLVLFYKHGNRVFPPGTGVVYSINGNNPNDVNEPHINKIKPFEHLTGNWYLSQNMTFVGPRIDNLTKTPKAFIDRSKIIEGVSTEELHRFDNWQNQKDLNNTSKLVNERNP